MLWRISPSRPFFALSVLLFLEDGNLTIPLGMSSVYYYTLVLQICQVNILWTICEQSVNASRVSDQTKTFISCLLFTLQDLKYNRTVVMVFWAVRKRWRLLVLPSPTFDSNKQFHPNQTIKISLFYLIKHASSLIASVIDRRYHLRRFFIFKFSFSITIVFLFPLFLSLFLFVFFSFITLFLPILFYL